MALALGTRLGTYEILAPLGAGGMGEVYRARDTRLGREVAVKVLPEALAASAERLARFEREARTVAGLNHPSIVTLFSVEDEDGVRFLTMELVEGHGLDNLITPGGLPLSRVLELSIPLADALVAAHERNVVHRDLKPGNVMVTREGRVKILDFGLAKTPGRDEVPEASEEATKAGLPDSSVSRAGQVLGTVPYMAPEQVRGEVVDARTDLFALGVILYELTTGRRPFKGPTSADISSAILRDTPALPTSLRPDLPGDMDRIIDRCLRKDPRTRYQSALDVCNDLRRVKHGLERGLASKPGAPTVASIAVLPFVNRSRDEGDEYFSDGLADELLNMLAKIRGLRVAARTSAFQFKARNESLANIGHKLNVETLLDGSVRKSGNRVRISVQLVKVSDGYHLWSETYDRTLDDIFAVQDDIAQSVVKELRTTLLGEIADSRASGEVKADVAKAAKGRAQSPEAHRIYLQARHFIDRLTREDTAKGIEYIKAALELEPAFALAWTVIGRAWTREADYGWVPVSEGYARARAAVERALALDPDLAEAHAGMGRIQSVYDWDLGAAKASYARALGLAPGNAVVLRSAGELARNLGQFDDAIDLNRRALEQDPLSFASYTNLGIALQGADRFVEAGSAYRKALELAPNRIGTHAALALTLLAQGAGEKALAEAALESEEAFRLWALAIVQHAQGHAAESDEALRMLIEKYGEDSAYQIAEVHAARGDADAAFEWLGRAYAQRDGGLITEMKASPFLRIIRGDPRWSVFSAKMGLAV